MATHPGPISRETKQCMKIGPLVEIMAEAKKKAVEKRDEGLKDYLHGPSAVQILRQILDDGDWVTDPGMGKCIFCGHCNMEEPKSNAKSMKRYPPHFVSWLVTISIC